TELEAIPQRKLNDARIAAVDTAIQELFPGVVAWNDVRQRAERGIAYCVLRMIERIEHLSTEHQRLPLGKDELLSEGQVKVVDRCSPDQVAAGGCQRPNIASNPESVWIARNVTNDLTGGDAAKRHDSAARCH